MEIENVVRKQHEYFNTGVTRPLAFRLNALRKLQAAVRANEQVLADAVKADMNKSAFEAYMCETGLVLDELRFHIKHLPSWVKNKRVRTPLAQFHAKSFTAPEPYGVTLIMSPWNYPIQLCLEPLIGALSAGNCAVIKPSAYAPHVSRAVADTIGSVFPPEYVAVVEGGREQNKALLEQKFDYIFFTGSVAVGKEVMAAASKNLTPVTLELGGKSPVIVDKTADIKLAARRIAFGKVLNSGQTCVEPDYLFIHESVKDAFLEAYAHTLNEFFADGDMSNMTVMINEKHFNRVVNLMKEEKAAIGGGYNAERLFIEPTVLVDITPESPIMQEEIFGPVLPVMPFRELEECIEYIKTNPKPLALYLFTKDKAAEEKVLNTCSFGGGCINDTIIHLATPHMGFGGVGDSGMGSYHGKLSFDTFTHTRSIVKKYNWIDMPMRYHPYTESKFQMIKKFLK